MRRRRRRVEAHASCATRPCPQCWAWDPDEIERLLALAGTQPVEEIVATLNQEFADRRQPRSYSAVRTKIVREGGSCWVQGWSMTDLCRLFNTSHHTIRRWWIDKGQLNGRRWRGRGCHAGWWFEPAEVERFIRECPWAYDWRRLDPKHPLRNVAELVNRADPWVPYREARAYFGLSEYPTDRWLRRGLIPHKRRAGAGGVGQIVVRARDLPDIAESIVAARLANRRAGAKLAATRRPQNQLGYRPARTTCRRICRCGARIVWAVLEPAPIACAFCARPVRGMGVRDRPREHLRLKEVA